jgi:anaphase-promoting complex subunit 1
VYNRPTGALDYTHAGVLMGLGLRGQLSALSRPDFFAYLSQKHDATTLAVLIGLAASRRGTMDPVRYCLIMSF